MEKERIMGLLATISQMKPIVEEVEESDGQNQTAVCCLTAFCKDLIEEAKAVQS